MRWLDSITNSVDMSLNRLQEIVKDREEFSVLLKASRSSPGNTVQVPQHHDSDLQPFLR